MTLNAKQFHQAARNGLCLYGTPSVDGRSIVTLYLAARSRDRQDVSLVRFFCERGMDCMHDPQALRGADVTPLSRDSTCWPIHFDAARFYGPAVLRVAY